MLASLADAPLDDPQLVYEPKYDGIRAIAEVAPSGNPRLWSRLGNEKTSQFPEIAAALGRWGRRLKAPAVLDGEIVALDAKGQPTRFQQLQRRIHVTGEEPDLHTAFIAFDILREGGTDLRDRPLIERRKVLERLFGRTGSPTLRISEMTQGDGRALYRRALDSGWEGLIAKHAGSLYKSGKRTPDWRKLKIVHEQEFVVGGWTEPRQTRAYFGALLLGVYESPGNFHRRGRKGRSGPSAVGDLVYVGHTGTGFNERELARVMTLLRPLEIKECPFRQRPPTNERPHWVQPTLVAAIKFTEWTADAKLRHPVYLGLRDDKDSREVRREETSRLHATSSVRISVGAELAPPRRGPTPAFALRASARPPKLARTSASGGGKVGPYNAAPLIQQLRALEDSRRDATIELPDGQRLAVTNLHKIFWPRPKLTKGDLLRYYAQVAPFILPAVADRPLVMKRFPDGVTGPPFYQHRVAEVPKGVRVETVNADRRPQLIGGELLTLLYMTQLAAISQDPWFSRVQSPQYADYVALDLDPMPGLAFGRTLEVARWIHDELESLGAIGVPKTSGAEGLHVYIPLPPETPYEAGLLLCQIIATVVAQKHPKQATSERAVAARGKRVYVDCLQNILGKTLATAYSARASEYAGVSTPLTWDEVHAGVDREAFTIQSVPQRLTQAGDLWAALRRAKGFDLARVARYAEGTGKGRLKSDKK
jgi:bifunctional non-homologous end joining protein LigD